MPSTNFDDMDLEQLRGECDRYAAAHLDRQLAQYRTPRAMKWSPADYAESAREIFAHRAGERLPATPHPLTAQRLQAQADWPTVGLVREILAAQFGDGVLDWDDRRILASGVGTPHLGDLYGQTANRRILHRMPKLLGKVLVFTTPTENKDFRATTTGVFELEAGVDTASESIREWQTMVPQATTEAVALRSSPVRLRFTVQLVTDEDVGMVAGIVDALVTAASQNELAAAFGVLNDNGNLADGSALFITANIVTGASKAAPAIDSAIGKLRAQSLNGAAVDADPYALLVPAGDEATARRLEASASPNRDWLRLVASDYLTAGAWYLTADPEVLPTLVRSTMQGSNGQSLTLGPGSPNEREGTGDVILEGLHTYRYQAASRIGIVKIEVS